MSPLRSACILVLLIALGSLVAGCTAGGPSGLGSIFKSVTEADLSAKKPHSSSTSANLPPGLSKASGAKVYADSGAPDGAANQTQTSFSPDESTDPVQAAASPGDFNLNFQNADLREVVEAILGNALQLTYTIDPTVAGTVTISSARPVKQDDLLPILEVVLQMNGAALVKDGKAYRIVPEASAVAGLADVGDASAGYGISILPLHFVSAQTLIGLIDGFGTRPGFVRVETARNLLIILGNSADRKAAIETALSFDADWMQDQSVAILPLQHTKPETVIPELERVFAAKEGGIGAGLIQFMPMTRLRAVLAVSPQRTLIERARTWVNRLDEENPNLQADVYVYRVKYRDSKKLADLLNQVFSLSSGTTAPDAAAAQVEPGSGISFSAGLGQQPGGSQDQTGQSQSQSQPGIGSQPQYNADNPDQSADQTAAALPAAEPTSTMQNGSAGGVRIQADISNNSIVIYSDAETRQQILAALARIDVPPLQVAINVTMAEVRLNDDLRYGVQYFVKSKSLGLGNDEGSFGLFNTVAANIGKELPGFNFVVGSNSSPDIIISALDQITDVQVLSSPSLVVVENETAKFQVGDQIPIVTRSVTPVDTADTTVANEIEYRDTGIILSVKPRVAENGVVSMTIQQEISSVASGSATLTPTIANRKVASSISVNDGQTVLLGGLISEQTDHIRAGIPGLSRVPVVGNLFGHKGRSNIRNELIILIRPSVIRQAEDAQHVAEELRSRMWVLGGSQAR